MEKSAHEVLDDELKKLGTAGADVPDEADDFLLDDDTIVDAADAKEAGGLPPFLADKVDDKDDDDKDDDKKDKKEGHQWPGLGNRTLSEVLDNPDFNEAFARTIEKDAGFRAALDGLADGLGIRDAVTG